MNLLLSFIELTGKLSSVSSAIFDSLTFTPNRSGCKHSYISIPKFSLGLNPIITQYMMFTLTSGVKVKQMRFKLKMALVYLYITITTSLLLWLFVYQCVLFTWSSICNVGNSHNSTLKVIALLVYQYITMATNIHICTLT